MVKEDVSAKNAYFRSIEDNFKALMKRAVEAVDPSLVQQALLKKWKDVGNTQKIDHVKASLDDYQAHIRVLEDAFHRIKSVTGMSEIRELVTTIIKTGEQHYALYQHMNKVNSEVDEIEEGLGGVRRVVGRLKDAHQSGEVVGAEILKELRGKRDGAVRKAEERKRTIAAVRESVEYAFVHANVRQYIGNGGAFPVFRVHGHPSKPDSPSKVSPFRRAHNGQPGRPRSRHFSVAGLAVLRPQCPALYPFPACTAQLIVQAVRPHTHRTQVAAH